jgi:hypothetical protein
LNRKCQEKVKFLIFFATASFKIWEHTQSRPVSVAEEVQEEENAKY